MRRHRRPSDIDCSQTHIVAPAGLRCRESNVVGTRGLATSTGGGQIKRWTSYGTVKQAKLYYYAQQVLSPRTYIQVGVMAEKIRGISPEAKNASSMSERTERSGVDFLTFVGAKGESCVGLRKIGPSTSAGAAWVLYATRCTPRGRRNPTSMPSSPLLISARNDAMPSDYVMCIAEGSRVR
jgi:hypothetical protein